MTDDPRFRRSKELAFGSLNRRADLHIAVSRAVASSPACRGARRVEVHMLGAELQPAEPASSPWPEATRLRLMTLSRLAWFKNIPAIVDAVALAATPLREAGAHLAIVGSGPVHDEVESAISRLGVGDLVSMQPAVSNPTWLYEHADALISCATLEGGPLTLFEASLAGTRLVSTPTGVAEDVIAVDPGSILMTGFTPDALAAGLLETIARGHVQPEDRVRRAVAAQRWHSRCTAPQFYDLLRPLMMGLPTR